MRVVTIGSFLGMCLNSTTFARAERIIPSAEQTTVLRGTADVNDRVRVVSGKTDATGHGSITLLPCSVSKRHVLFTHGKLRKSRKFCLSAMVKVMKKL